MESAQISKPVWQLLDEQRSHHGRLDLLQLVERAASRGIQISYEELGALARKSHADGYVPVPQIAIEFLIKLCNDRAVRSILDPWAASPQLVSEVARGLEPEHALAITQSEHVKALGDLMAPPTSLEWRIEDPQDRKPKESDPAHDLVVSAPPWFGGRKEAKRIAAPDGMVEVRDSPDHLTILEAATQSAPDALVAAIVKPAFFFRGSQKSCWASMQRLGLFAQAALYLPPGSFLPATGIAGYLLVVAREPAESMFVAELSPEAQIAPVLANFRKRKSGKALGLGTWVSPSKFVSFPAIMSTERFGRLVRRAGLEPRELSELVEEIRLPRRGDGKSFEDLPNSVFLPTIGTSPAVLSTSEFKVKPQNYVQLLLRPAEVEASYLARFFSTEIGRLVRDMASTGVTIPKISRLGLEGARVALPSPSIQAEQLKLAGKVASMKSALEGLEERVWSEPRALSQLSRSVRHLGRDDALAAWAEELPFPLSSIYWRQKASKASRMKEEHLLHFFEATSGYLALIMLSAVGSSGDAFAGDRARILTAVGRDRLTLPTFGVWVSLGSQLAKFTRRQLSGRAEQQQTIRHAYRVASSTALERITDKQVYTLLDEVAGWRNEWRGHGGVESANEARRRVAKLSGRLQDLQVLVGDALSMWKLITPVSAKYSEGIYANTVRSLMGPNSLFPEELLETTIPLDTSSLYLVEDGNTIPPLELLPLLRMMAGPESEPGACYFFNRLGKDGARWVSYHYAEQSEQHSKGTRIQAALARLFGEE